MLLPLVLRTAERLSQEENTKTCKKVVKNSVGEYLICKNLIYYLKYIPFT